MKKYLYVILVLTFLLVGNYLIGSNLISNSQKALILQVGIYIIAALSLNLIVSSLGEFCLGHAGFMAIGAYTCGLLVKNNCYFLLAIIISGVFALLIGIVVGCFSLKFKGDYLAIITLGISEIIRYAIINFEPLTGGAKGLKSIPKYSNFLLVYVLVILSYMFFKNFLDSKYGRAIYAIREDDIAAKSIFVNINRSKLLVFGIAGFFAGVSGALWAGFQGVLSPNEFGFTKSIEILVMIVFGGMNSLMGVVLSADVLVSFPLILQRFIKNFNDYRMISYSVLLILVILIRGNKLKVRLKNEKVST